MSTTITTTDGGYDLHLLLRADYPDFTGFSRFLQEHVADRLYVPFPLPLGGRLPPNAPPAYYELRKVE